MLSVNQTIVTYHKIGERIVEEEKVGNERAVYVKQIVKQLSKALTTEFGKGFSVKNLEQMRSFYQVYGKSSTLLSKPEGANQQTVSVEFRKFYIQETF